MVAAGYFTINSYDETLVLFHKVHPDVPRPSKSTITRLVQKLRRTFSVTSKEKHHTRIVFMHTKEAQIYNKIGANCPHQHVK